MKKRVLLLLTVGLLFLSACSSSSQDESVFVKKDVIVITDGDQAAKNAMTRMTLYLNDLNVKGIYDVSEDGSFKDFYTELAKDYASVSENLKGKDEAYPENIENLYSNELEKLEDLKDVYVLDFTKSNDLSNINLENVTVLSAYAKEVKADKHIIFEAYEDVFGSKWHEQDQAYKKAFHPSVFAEMESYNSPIYKHYQTDEEGFIGELPSLTFLSIVNEDLTWLDDTMFSSWTGRLLLEKGQYRKAAEDIDIYESEASEKYSLQRFVELIQQDFQNRLAWTVNEGSTHPTVSFTENMLTKVKAGSEYKVQVKVSEEADYYYNWWYYHELDDADLDLEIDGWGSSIMNVTIPEDAEKGTKFHFMLELEDAITGHKSMYRRVVEVK